jgi:hypothetical protein
MDRDSSLIFESYKKANYELISEQDLKLLTEEEESWWLFAAKVLDPTGVLSYGDLSRASGAYAKDQNAVNFALLLLGIFNALPNFGLLAAGWGGIGWGALKMAAKGAAKKSPQAAVKAAESILNIASRTPGVAKAFEKGVNTLLSKKIVDKGTANMLKDTVLSGKLPGALKSAGGKYATKSGLLKGQQAALGKFSRLPAERAIAGAAKAAYGKFTPTSMLTKGVGVGGKYKALSRATAPLQQGYGVEYPSFLPQKLLPGQADAGGGSTPTGSSSVKQELLDYIRNNRN